MKKETKVKCEVKSCKHNIEKYCDLDELDISCICDTEKCIDKNDTICKSFEKDKRINSEENEYEYEQYDDEFEGEENFEELDEILENNELEENFE